MTDHDTTTTSPEDQPSTTPDTVDESTASDEAVGEDSAPESAGNPPQPEVTDAEHLPPGQTAVPVGDEVVVDDETMRRALEAILMVTDEPLPVLTLARAVGRPTGDVAAALTELAAEYTDQGRGFDLREVGGGWRYYTRVEAAPYVERFVLDGQQARLTQAALETLAVVAYKQPVSRARVSAIRGVNVDGVMRTLVARGLVEEAGADTESQATLYRTTTYFLERMGMQSLDDLPELAPYLPEMDDIEEELAAQTLPPAEAPGTPATAEASTDTSDANAPAPAEDADAATSESGTSSAHEHAPAEPAADPAVDAEDPAVDAEDADDVDADAGEEPGVVGEGAEDRRERVEDGAVGLSAEDSSGDAAGELTSTTELADSGATADSGTDTAGVNAEGDVEAGERLGTSAADVEDAGQRAGADAGDSADEDGVDAGAGVGPVAVGEGAEDTRDLVEDGAVGLSAEDSSGDAAGDLRSTTELADSGAETGDVSAEGDVDAREDLGTSGADVEDTGEPAEEGASATGTNVEDGEGTGGEGSDGEGSDREGSDGEGSGRGGLGFEGGVRDGG